jgi:hypothetical protein
MHKPYGQGPFAFRIDEIIELAQVNGFVSVCGLLQFEPCEYMPDSQITQRVKVCEPAVKFTQDRVSCLCAQAASRWSADPRSHTDVSFLYLSGVWKV